MNKLRLLTQAELQQMDEELVFCVPRMFDQPQFSDDFVGLGAYEVEAATGRLQVVLGSGSEWLISEAWSCENSKYGLFGAGCYVFDRPPFTPAEVLNTVNEEKGKIAHGMVN